MTLLFLQCVRYFTYLKVQISHEDGGARILPRKGRMSCGANSICCLAPLFI